MNSKKEIKVREFIRKEHNKIMENYLVKENLDLKDIILGFGIGICFSVYWKIGIFLIGLSIIASEIEDFEYRERKKKLKVEERKI